jgi:N-acetylglucosamine-6-phosphate deacetylase
MIAAVPPATLRLDATAAVLPDRTVTPASVLVDRDAGTILAAGRPDDVDAHPAATAAEREAVDGTLLPGFVELQVNGAAGHDFRAPDVDGAGAALRALLRTGVTTCCPTIVTQPPDRYLPSIAAVAAAVASAATSTVPRVPGVHLEGPFLADEQRGAHRRSWLQRPDRLLVEALLGEGALPIAIWTLAPELDGALAVVGRLAAAGTTVSAGHTGATDADLDGAVDAGLTMVTHLGNGMPPFHHRRPGPVGWALAHPSVRAGLVIDGHHVHPTVLRLFRSLLGDRAFGVTDALHVLGLPPGVHQLEGTTLDTTTGVARIGGPDGTLAGAVVGMDAMAGALLAAGDDHAAVARLCSTGPADALGLSHLGRIAPGCAADLLAFDAGHRLTTVWVAGKPAIRGIPPSG